MATDRSGLPSSLSNCSRSTSGMVSSGWAERTEKNVLMGNSPEGAGACARDARPQRTTAAKADPRRAAGRFMGDREYSPAAGNVKGLDVRRPVDNRAGSDTMDPGQAGTARRHGPAGAGKGGNMKKVTLAALTAALAAGFVIILSAQAGAVALSPIEELGKKLFFDKNLSSPPGQDCAL